MHLISLEATAWRGHENSKIDYERALARFFHEHNYRGFKLQYIFTLLACRDVLLYVQNQAPHIQQHIEETGDWVQMRFPMATLRGLEDPVPNPSTSSQAYLREKESLRTYSL